MRRTAHAARVATLGVKSAQIIAVQAIVLVEADWPLDNGRLKLSVRVRLRVSRRARSGTLLTADLLLRTANSR